MLPRVAEEKLAEYCDVFCEPNVFPVEQARTVLRAAQALGSRPARTCRPVQRRLRLAARRRTACRDGRSPGILDAGRPGRPACGRRAARAASGIGLQSRLYTLPGGAPHDRSRPARGAGHRFQSRKLADRFHADGALAGRHTDEDDGGRVDHGRHHQCGVQPRGGDTEIGSLEPGKAADFVIHDCDDYRELPYFFGRDPALAVYVAGRPVLYTGK